MSALLRRSCNARSETVAEYRHCDSRYAKDRAALVSQIETMELYDTAAQKRGNYPWIYMQIESIDTNTCFGVRVA